MFDQARSQAQAQGKGAGVRLAVHLAWCVLAFVCLSAGAASAQVPNGCPVSLQSETLVQHDFGFSFCELCEVGRVRIVVENPVDTFPGDIDFSEITVREDLRASGLTYVPGSTSFSTANVGSPGVAFEPDILSGGSVLEWTFPPGYVLPENPGGSSNDARLVIEFQVERAPPFSEEGLVSANLDIQPTVEVTPTCATFGDSYTQSAPVEPLPLREPDPRIQLRGRNLDAGQGPGQYSDPVYGHENDDVIWRIRVTNAGQGDLQDFVFTNEILPGNFEMNHICTSNASAEAAAGGASPAQCRPLSGTNQLLDFDVAANFGGGANPYIVLPAGATRNFYIVGRVTGSCDTDVSTVSAVEWGCQSEPPVGGIGQTSTGLTPGDTAQLRTFSQESQLDLDVDLTGINTSQPMGARGFVTINVRNQSGGTILGKNDGIEIRSLLPAQYVVDPTAPPVLTMNPAYGTAYGGMVDTLTWSNPAAPGSPLSNTDLQFVLTSSTTNPDFADQEHMIRHGDVATITIRVVQIDPTYYDLTANLDVREEAPNSDPLNTDPQQTFAVTSRAEIWYDEFCSNNPHHVIENENDTANPEDLDIDLGGSELLFILTATGDPLPLSVQLTNNGGHDAEDYETYVTFGQAMTVQTAPGACSLVAGAPLLPPWELPAALPGTGTVYRCDAGTIAPGSTRTFAFDVVKNTSPPFDDDLTFRADVIGESRLSDGSPLTFPAPVQRADLITDRGNNYSLDGIRARVVGYNLLKTQLGDCSEENLVPPNPADHVEIGEECSFRIESGGWFGFQTPGFTYIAVQDIQVLDQSPDGQAYVSSTDPLVESTPAIMGVTFTPPPVTLSDADFDWRFNTNPATERITEKDHWFRTNFTSRLLNDPIDTVAAPNQQAAQSSNVLTSTFQAVFYNAIIDAEEVFDLGPSTIGFPREVFRRVDLTVTEPQLTVVKTVCNETRNGVGEACTDFRPLVDDGDAFDTYVFRVEITNAPDGGGAPRAPAYDVTVTSVADPSDQLFVLPLDSDTIDNDADTDVDGGDGDGEGSIVDNTVLNMTPAQVISSYTNTAALQQIDPGETVTLYYRVDPNDEVSPLQQLTNSVTASYDSLSGDFGNQSILQRPSGDEAGARRYTSAPSEATIQIIPVEVSPKEIIAASESPLSGPGLPQPAVIGEELEFQLQALIPVSQLRDFVVRDELPPGLVCAEAPDVDLNAPPYDAAGFVPGGTFTPTCTADEVIWDFGDQRISTSPRADRRFDFRIGFIGRVENVIGNQALGNIVNGGASTTTQVEYVNEADAAVVLPIGAATVVVQEPVVDLVKAFSVPEVDAGDLPRVTVTATNSGTSTAYNVRVLEDLTHPDLSYAGDIQGANPPTADVATFGPDRPLFTWASGLSLAPGESVSFSFAVEVGAATEPLRVLDNTVQADWTSLARPTTALNSLGTIGANGAPDGMRIGALPNALDPLNDYEAEASASVSVPPAAVAKTDLDVAVAPEIGAHKSFEIVVTLPEGVTRNVVVSDALDSGDVSYVLSHDATWDITYQFDGIAQIAGQAPSESAFAAVPTDGESGTIVWSLGDVETASEDDLATMAITPTITIRYSAYIANDLVTDAGDSLQNTVTTTYLNGQTGATESVMAQTAPVAAIEPTLTSSKVLANVTPGKAPTDPPAFDDVLEYVVTFVNSGMATAHDVNIVDTLPPELALELAVPPTATITTVGAPVPVVGFVPVPSGSPDGPLVWGRGNGDPSIDIPSAAYLELTYQVRVRTPLVDPAVLSNRVWVDWTSLDGASPFERTGAGCPVTTAPDDYCFGPAVADGNAVPIPPPAPVGKANTQPTASVGETFSYRITVPSVPYAFPIWDVQIRDDLGDSLADMRFVSVTKVSGSGAWTPVNTGTDTDLVIEDETVGIDIPAGEQIVIDVTVVLEDTGNNTTGLTFTNVATQLYNWVDGDPSSQRPGMPGTTAPMTIVGPDTLVMDKRGPGQITAGVPASYTLDVQNTGDGRAWDLVLTDVLPDTANGGTCATAPTVTAAQVYAADGITTVSPVLAEGADFAVSFTPAPTCELEIAFTGVNASVAPTERLIVTYDAALDPGSDDSVALTNVAGVTRWFSAQGPDAREYTRALTDGTPLVDDHQDTVTIDSALPLYRFDKTVVNLTTGQDPAIEARPGDTLRYRLEVENLGTVAGGTFSLVDDLDALNATPVFVPGSLTNLTAPVGADTSNTSGTGGASGTGLLDVRDLDLPNQNDTLFVEFDITLAPVIAAGTAVTNQAQLVVGASPFARSDDPNVGAPPDPLVPGDEDPTVVTILSAPAFQIQKTSAYVTGDPAVLLAGETLRYTITVKNVGTDDAVDAMLRDSVPVNTTYVSGSTTLNGALVPDAAGGASPLATGLPISAPEDPTPGAMRADVSPAADNVATLVFDVVVDASVADGTVISNQAFVDAITGGVVSAPSDDPRTATPDDPTRDVVGNLPLLFAAKSVSIAVDGGSMGVVDPNDVLEYTITVQNSGAVAATATDLLDAVPANTAYVPGTTTLNGLAVPDGPGGAFPLAAGLPISSTSGTPPLPAPGAGTLAPGESAVVVFRLQVDGATPFGTLISNQAVVGSTELPNLPTDGDGNPTTGPEPTVVVVGAAQQLSIAKTVTVVGGGAALPGSVVEYEVRVANVSTVDAQDVVITDDLALPVAGQLVYVPGSATMNGVPTGVVVAGTLITADYSMAGTVALPAGASVVLRFRATIDASLAIGTTVTNTGTVSWNTPTQTASASVSFTVGGMPGVGMLSGALWHDVDFDQVQDAGEDALAGWTVELLRAGTVVFTTQSDAAGAYTISGLQPNDVSGEPYALRFRAPQATATTASLGQAVSPYTNGPQTISDLIVPSGSVLQGLNLPIQPNGVVYDSVERVAIAGAVVSLRNAGTGAALPTQCFDDPAQQGQVTLGSGFYKFDLNFSSAACPSGGDYLIDVTGAAAGFSGGLSQIIPPTTDATTAAFSVPGCLGGPNDVIPATGGYCEVQASPALPPASVPARTPGTAYYAHLQLDSSQLPGSAQAFHNHLALDPGLDAAVSITKTTPLVNVVLGQLVPYEITVDNQLAVDLLDVVILDTYPAGFQYIEGSARLDGAAVEPTRSGRVLRWPSLDIAPATRHTLQLLLAVGAGVTDGEYTNQAQVVSGVGDVPLSGTATATVKVVPDPDFACTDAIGKVFDDRNRDGAQDAGEPGLSGVRLVTPRGLVASTDEHGRYHITCAIVPAEGRGSNFVLKLDERTLPSGYRMSTRAVQVARATRGKAIRMNYGASIHRVVGLDVADAAFEPGEPDLRPQWATRIPLVLEQLEEAESTLRISYIGDVESARLVDRRIDALEDTIRAAWRERGKTPLTIESDVYWRRGAPAAGWLGRLGRFDRWWRRADPPVRDGEIADAKVGPATERHFPAGAVQAQWVTDPELLETQRGDRIEEREVVKQKAKTIKLKNVVPPLRFETGAVELPASYVRDLRQVLADMSHLDNVRLHLVGHADSQPLTGRLASEYGDNLGLSRERAGEVAEFVQKALDLPPESISYSWAGEAEPLASNATAEGRALNRRVEVEVWYDEIEETLGVEDFVVSEVIKRVKVCRIETVCKMRFIEGHERRSRVRNLVAPLTLGDQGAAVSDAFVQQVAQGLENLQDKGNVTVKFVGFTDAAPLDDRSARIYGTHLALSKANAHRVALAVKDALGLSTSAIASDGRGTAQPIASNETPHGRAMNRRVEVEFWYDDPLQELDEDLQICPEDLDETLVTRVYDPPWGRIPALELNGGTAVLPDGLEDQLRQAMADVADKSNVRLRFVGYTANERLDRRSAMVYGDDVGLSIARARRAMERVQASMGLGEAQVEAEGRGYVHSQDVVNAGFTQEGSSHVVVQVVYDEPAVLDDYDGVEITRITRELEPRDPLALNLMRISVDGEPIDDRDRSSADVQRCTDVALERANVQFRFDGLETDRRLTVASGARAVAAGEGGSGGGAPAAIPFRMYTNYGHYIERSEVRVFDREASLRSEPLAVLPIGPDGQAEWRPGDVSFEGPVRELKFVLRAYGRDGRFDETVPQSLWMVKGRGESGGADTASAASVVDDARAKAADEALSAGYGETDLATANIDLGNAGTVRVQGERVPEGHTVWIAGEPVPVADNGEFIAEAVLPQGLQTVEVAVLDEQGNGDLFLRDIDFDRSEWFYVAMADVTLNARPGGGPPSELTGANSQLDPDSVADGRFAFFLTGRFGEDWSLTASADTGEGSFSDLFTNFLDKSPDALFRRIDPDYHYPTFGDNGVVEQMAPSSGKFYVRVDQGENHAMWGNFGVSYVDTEIARVERGLYGANVHYQTEGTTSFGEKRLELDGFAADPGTVSSRQDFRGTGGSLYYLRHRDLMIGSERLRVEVRDKVTGLVTSVTHLSPDEDYDIDYFQGRILLARPISTTVDDSLLVRNAGQSGNELWLVVQYEYAPGFDELDSLAAGGEGHYWLNDYLKLGVTAYTNSEDDTSSGLYAGNIVARMTSNSWLKLQAGYSEGLVAAAQSSQDGGFDFGPDTGPAFADQDAPAFRADLSVGLADIFDGASGGLTFYFQRLYAGYSVPGLSVLTDTDFYGGTLVLPVTRQLAVNVKADRVDADGGLATNTQEVDARFQLTDEVSLSAGVRNDDRQDDSAVLAATQETGGLTDVVVEAGFDSQADWRAYVFGQMTVRSTGDREDNRRVGAGGELKVNDRLEVEGEVSYGDYGPLAKVGTNYQQSVETSRYLNYSLDNERATTGAHSRRGNLVNGARTRLSDSASVYQEDRYQHTSSANGLSRAIGLDWALTERWTVGAEWEYGTLIDAQTFAETRRNAGGGRLSYRFDKLYVSSGVEYRSDETEQPDASWSERTTWLFRNDFRLQLTPDWRMLGKFNHSFSNSSLGEFYDGGFTEAVLGYGYRPVNHDRLDILAKYTYFQNMPTTDQLGASGTSDLFLQKSHVFSLDATYALTRTWTLGGKYAYRLGQVSLDRDEPDYFDNGAHLGIARLDWRFHPKWESTVEGRTLSMPDIDQRRSGALISLYYYLGKHFKVGVGYNFTDFSEDLTDLSYDSNGIFFNLIGTL